MTMHLFWFDSVPDDERRDELALHASRFQAHAWNGFHVPLVTAAEFRRFIAAWGVNDPGGDWADAVIADDRDLLTIRWACGERDVFMAFDGPKGAPVYGIDGFTWAEPTTLDLFKSEHPTMKKEQDMTPKNPARMPLREKIVLGTLASVAAVGARLLATPDAKAEPVCLDVDTLCAPVDHCQPDGCDPSTLLLGPQPVPPSAATTWQELILPSEFR